MLADPRLLQRKYAKVINLYSRTYGIDPLEAKRLFYDSDVYYLMKNGISDMHCMDPKYLVEELHDEVEKMK